MNEGKRMKKRGVLIPALATLALALLVGEGFQPAAAPLTASAAIRLSRTGEPKDPGPDKPKGPRGPKVEPGVFSCMLDLSVEG
jgi:hypothetical protein